MYYICYQTITKVMSKYIYIIAFVLISSSLFSQEPYFFEVKPIEGEGIYDLLERYELNRSDCNLDKFCSLNDLALSDNLILDRKYKLPVKIYEYNGKSIRSTIGVSNYDNAVSIRDYNLRLLDLGIRQTDYRNSNILWVPYENLKCAIRKEEDDDVITIDLFGEKHKNFKKIDNTLESKVFYLTSGHGGPDPGAVGSYGNSNLCEDEYAYDVTLRLAKKLIQHGAKVHVIIRDKDDGIRNDAILTCDYDEVTLNEGKIPLNQVRRLKQRTKSINDLYYLNKSKGYRNQTAVVIHVDSRRKNKRQDVFFMHYKRSNKGKSLADNLLDTFSDKYKIHRASGNYDGEVETRNLFLLRETIPPAIFIELGNIRNSEDQQRILLESNRQALADWIYEGLVKDAQSIAMN